VEHASPITGDGLRGSPTGTLLRIVRKGRAPTGPGFFSRIKTEAAAPFSSRSVHVQFTCGTVLADTPDLSAVCVSTAHSPHLLETRISFCILASALPFFMKFGSITADMYNRVLDLSRIIQHKSVFLFDPRQTGKSTLDWN
jgi:hypothetical protein